MVDIENIFVAKDESTFQYEDNLPSLPVPPLNKTLAKYLESVRPFTNADEYQNTEKLVTEFKNGVGSVLHFNLQEKAKKMSNWLETWWELYAYLVTRQPLIPCSNLAGTILMDKRSTEWNPDQLGQIKKAAWTTYFIVKFWNLLRKEKLKPDKPRGQPWSMSQYKRLFSTYRIPGETSDKLVFNFVTEKEGPPSSDYVIVLCRGNIFKMQVLDSHNESLTVPELEKLFSYISNESLSYGQTVAAMTCDNRTSWAKNRKYLIDVHPENNKNLALVENAITFVVLDESSPTNETQFMHYGLGGDIRNRWADSFNTIVFKNGTSIGNADHTPVDGIVAVMYDYFLYVNLQKDKGQWQGSKNIRDIPLPIKLTFHLDKHLELAINTAITKTTNLIDQMVVLRTSYVKFGKQFVTSNKMNPDTFLQQCLQLAYFRMHNKPAPTYETATTRAFYHGRTETVRSCTSEAITWAKSMLDPSTNRDQRRRLLGIAMAKHDLLMAQAKQNEGCDRHLFGLYVLCLETGQPIPKIFTDPIWAKSGGGGNFILSTSLSGYMPTTGCVTAMCQDGYGVFYSILPNQINFNITAWKTSRETNIERFFKAIEKSLDEMQNLYLQSTL